MQTYAQINRSIRYVTMVLVNRECQRHLGYNCNRGEIIQKIAHLNKYDFPLPCSPKAMLKHVIATVERYARQIAPTMKAQCIAQFKAQRKPVVRINLP